MSDGTPNGYDGVHDRRVSFSPDHFARLTHAFEEIAMSLVRLADVHEMRYAKDYPSRKEPTDATVTRIPTADDRIKESQRGEADQSLSQWLNDDPADSPDANANPDEADIIGPREREYISRKRGESNDDDPDRQP